MQSTANAVVVKDVPDNSVVAGIPAKVIKYRFSNDVIEKLQEIRWWDMSDDEIISHKEIFAKENLTVEDIIREFK